MDKAVLELILLLIIQRAFADPQKESDWLTSQLQTRNHTKSRTQNMYPSTRLIQVLKFILLVHYVYIQLRKQITKLIWMSDHGPEWTDPIMETTSLAKGHQRTVVQSTVVVLQSSKIFLSASKPGFRSPMKRLRHPTLSSWKEAGWCVCWIFVRNTLIRLSTEQRGPVNRGENPTYWTSWEESSTHWTNSVWNFSCGE